MIDLSTLTPFQSSAVTLLGERSVNNAGFHPLRPRYMLVRTETPFHPDLPIPSDALRVTPIGNANKLSFLTHADWIDDHGYAALRIPVPASEESIAISVSRLRTWLNAPAMWREPMCEALTRVDRGEHMYAITVPVEETNIQRPTDAITAALKQWNRLHPASPPLRIKQHQDTPYLAMSPAQHYELQSKWFEAMNHYVMLGAHRPLKQDKAPTPPPQIALDLRCVFANQSMQQAFMFGSPAALPPMESVETLLLQRYNMRILPLVKHLYQSISTATRRDEMLHIPATDIVSLRHGLQRTFRTLSKPMPQKTSPEAMFDEYLGHIRRGEYTVALPFSANAGAAQQIADRLDAHFANAEMDVELRRGPSDNAWYLTMKADTFDLLRSAYAAIPQNQAREASVSGTVTRLPLRNGPANS